MEISLGQRQENSVAIFTVHWTSIMYSLKVEIPTVCVETRHSRRLPNATIDFSCSVIKLSCCLIWWCDKEWISSCRQWVLSIYKYVDRSPGTITANQVTEWLCCLQCCVVSLTNLFIFLINMSLRCHNNSIFNLHLK